MCYTQIVHHCFHADKISFHAEERESHVCDVECWPYDEGYKCPAHTCCWIVLENDIYSCDERMSDGTCIQMMEDEVFVQEQDETEEEKKMMNEAQERPGVAAADIEEGEEACMEFWPEDQEGKAVLVFLEDGIDGSSQ
ncbi:uncharacterized protein PG998_013261 [Apiospora kogelbergensis]|uniref:uncharacterized protein n=1 Tax=Apiospora kogelbergensis TaxID=1337665 RepID=UPI0031303D77